MKKIHPSSLLKAVAVLLLGTMTFSACKKDEVGGEILPDSPCTGTPTITSLTTTVDRTTVVHGSKQGQWLIVTGENLCGLTKIMFNNVEAKLTDAYAKGNTLTIQVPDALPTEITNKLQITTQNGQVEYDFQLELPPLAVFGMENEYTAEGDTLLILGQNFYLNGINKQLGKVYFGDVLGTIVGVSSDSLWVKVPAGVASGAKVKVVGPGVEKTVTGTFRDDRNVFITSDPFWGWWGYNYVTAGATPKPIAGNYIRVNRMIDSWAWTEVVGGMSTGIPADAMAHPGNYTFKFEINTLKPYNTMAIRFEFDGNTYTWEPFTLDTHGRWRTVSIDFADIVKMPVGPKNEYYMQLRFHGPGPLDADMSFDNFRLTPKE